MQADMLRASRTATKPKDPKEKLPTILTVSSTGKEKDQSQQVRHPIYLICTVHKTNLRNFSQ